MMDEHRIVRLDVGNTTVTFEVPWIAGIPVRGRFSAVHGKLEMPDDDIEHAELNVHVVAESVATGIALRDSHLRGARFLDASRWPYITFRSERVSRTNGSLEIEGVLTLRGVERRVTSTCPLNWVEGQGMSGTLSLCTELVVPHTEHGVAAARGLDRFNPLLAMIGREVHVRTEIAVPATRLLPALLPALGR
jgi:polyisoprenoid-binding protein YceI